MKKKLTMQDIATMSGVAKSTVSRYFNGGYVKDETRAIIRKVIEQNNYEPNAFAQSLKAKESRIIGVIAPCLDSTVSGRILMAIDEYLRKENYVSLFINTNHDASLELKSLESLWRMKVDGVILLATEVTKEHAQIVKRLDIPVLFVAQEYKEGVSIIFDDYHAGYKVGEYASQMGYQDVVYVGVDETDEAVGIKRKQGVLDGLKKNGVHHMETVVSDFHFDHNLACLEQLFDSKIPQLLICATDRQAMAAYNVIQRRHLRIPQDVAVIGFGGYDVREVLTPKLTTIRFDAHKAGFLAGETIVHMIKARTVAKTQVVTYTFLEGMSAKKM